METQSHRAADAAQPLGYIDSEPQPSRIPGWVKITALMLIIVILLAAAMMLLGGGHNPMQHF